MWVISIYEMCLINLIIRRAAVEAAIRKKRECERKALAIVEHMVESETVDTQWLADNVICKTMYSSVKEDFNFCLFSRQNLSTHLIIKMQLKRGPLVNNVVSPFAQIA